MDLKQQLRNPQDCKMWAEAVREKFEGQEKRFGRTEFDRLLGHCQVRLESPEVGP
jgi:hypothetical protein